MILSFDKPKKARSTEAHNFKYSSDTGVPGSYVPNMSDEDAGKWKARYLSRRIEIRKTFRDRAWSQVLIVVYRDGCIDISMNNKTQMSVQEFQEFQEAIMEAEHILRTGVIPE